MRTSDGAARRRLIRLAVAVVVVAALAVTGGVLLNRSGAPGAKGSAPKGSAPNGSAPNGSAPNGSAPNGSAPGSLATSPAASLPPGPSTPPAGAYDVVTYGADPSGRRDSTAGIRSAIAAASAASAGGSSSASTVYLPAGTYILDDHDAKSTDFSITAKVDIVGAGASTTRVVEEVGTVKYPGHRGKNVFVFQNTANGVTFSGITVDAQTYNAGDALDVHGNDSTVEASAFLGGRYGTGGQTDGANVYDLKVAGFCNQHPGHRYYGNYRSGNVVKDVVLSGIGVGGNDDLDFSCEHNGTISNVTDTGWGVALYIDQNVTITDYRYTPGRTNAAYGYFVTASDNITIDGFVTSGSGGKISSPNFPSRGITIRGERMTTPGFSLSVGDVAGLSITGSRLAGLTLSPQHGASQISAVGTTIAAVTCKAGATITGLAGLSCGGAAG